MKCEKSFKMALPPDEYGEFTYGENDSKIFYDKHRGANTGIASRIKAARSYLGYTQAELARKCNVSQQVIKNIESGRKKELPSGYVKALAKALGISIEMLLYGVKPPSLSVNWDIGLEQQTIDWLHHQKEENPDILRLINSLFRDPKTAATLFNAVKNYLEADRIPFVCDSEGVVYEDYYLIDKTRGESMQLIEEALKQYWNARPRYKRENEELSQTQERAIKRRIEKMTEERVALKRERDKANQCLIEQDGEITEEEAKECRLSFR